MKLLNKDKKPLLFINPCSLIANLFRPYPHTPILPYIVLLLLIGCSPPDFTWNEEQGYRWAELRVKGDEAGFEMLPAAQTGVTFVNHLTDEQIVENRHRMHGSGVALGDVDGDGLTDIYFTRLDGDNVLYRNLGAWRFEDITAEAGVAAPDRFSTGAVMADIDGDYDLDLLLTALGGPNAAFLNDGSGQFEEATHELGLASNMGSTSMALADVEGDGDLDLYVANYKRIALRDSLPPEKIAWDYVVQPEGDGYRINPTLEDHYTLRVWDQKLIKLENAEPDGIYLNDGQGRFQNVLDTNGFMKGKDGKSIEDVPKDWALAVRFQDINDDGAPDLYVCNDFDSPDHVWINNQIQGFYQMSELPIRKTSNATMSVAFSDINRDGEIDIFMADMLSPEYSRKQTQRSTQIPLPLAIGEIHDRPQVMRNTLLLSRGDGTYAETANIFGVPASNWTWSSVFLDVDLDGYEDLLLTTGHAFDVQNLDAQGIERRKISRLRNARKIRSLLLEFPPLDLPNVAFRNEAGRRFIFQPDGWGLGEEADVSHGMALADLDNDGDLDVVVNRLNALAGLYENSGDASRIAVRLKGAAGNTQGIGAKIRLLGGSVPVQEKEVVSGGLYLSGSDPVYSFAAGEESDGLEIEVEWRNGKRTKIEGVQPNRIYEIEETSSSDVFDAISQEVSPAVFEEVALDHIHHEDVFDDFARQPLLPRRYSQMGPAVAWADVDRDGDDDLLVGSGRGGSLSYYRNDAGRMVKQSAGPAGTEADVDQAGIVVIPAGSGSNVLVAFSNYESETPAPSRIEVFSVDGRRWRRTQTLDAGSSGIGPLAAADVDGDGDIDVFAGGAIAPGQYPQPASSRLFLFDGSYVYDESKSQPFADLGMVHGAVFGDIDADGDQDLALALEWGGLKLFENDGAGQYRDASSDWGLGDATGLWQGVELGDFDGDGQLDIIATNWGWNTQFGRPADPLRLYWGDFDGNGITDVLEAHYESSMNGYVPEVGLNLLWYSMPFLRRSIQSFESFSEMTIDQVIGPRFDIGESAEVRHLAHRVYFNRGDTFEGRDLPMMAQISPGFGVAIGDYDADGFEDAFIAQNFFAERLEVPRNDAGRGLWVRGAGDGTFALAEGTTTGIKVYGEQRGVGLADYNNDGRLDVAVSQNGNALKLYRNVESPTGLSVRLQGPPANPWGIGSRIQVVYEDGSKGPVRNVAAGSGYLGQRSPVQVMGVAEGKTIVNISVVWPDGTEQVVEASGEEVVVEWEEGTP